MSKYILVDTDVIQKLHQGTNEEKGFVERLLNSTDCLLFYSSHTRNEMTLFRTGATQLQLEQAESELRRFRSIDDSANGINPIRVINASVRDTRRSIISNSIGLAFKRVYPAKPLTHATSYEQVLREDNAHHNFKDFRILTPLSSFRFDYFLTFDRRFYRFCVEQMRFFEMLGCKPLTLNAQVSERFQAVVELGLD